MIVAGVLFMSICLLVDHLIFDRLLYVFKGNVSKNLVKSVQNMDDDVRAEKEKVDKISNAELKNGNLVLRKLTKTYKKTLAVNQLDLGVDNAECFGLLVSFQKK